VAIMSDVTLSLTCTGPGGSATQSVAVTATAATSGSHGGGGLDSATLALLALLAGALRVRATPAFSPRAA
jgi:hypothetical protein